MANPVNFYKVLTLPSSGNREANSVFFVNADPDGVKEIHLTDSSNNLHKYAEFFEVTTFLSYMSGGFTIPTSYAVPNYPTSPTWQRGLINWDNGAGEFSFQDGITGRAFELSACLRLESNTLTNRVAAYIILEGRFRLRVYNTRRKSHLRKPGDGSRPRGERYSPGLHLPYRTRCGL